MTCFCFTFVSRSFETLELTRRRNLTVSFYVSMFGSRNDTEDSVVQERQSGVTGSVVKKSSCERFVCWKDGSNWFLVFRDTRGTSFYLT